VAGVGERAPEPLVVPLAMLGDDASDGTLGILELRRGVDERAAAIVRMPDLGDHIGAERFDEIAALGARRVLVRSFHEMLVNPLQVADDEVLLARKVSIEGRQRDFAGRNDAVHADVVDSLGVEQL
jgi:hypothetical protein